MYSTCLFCHHALGANDVLEQFPVGRRIAFDGAKGRLWAVCPSCGRWNLSGIEERWEAIEDAERRFRATPLRMQTAEIGLARHAEGLELIRIGEPLRPEFAAWRYGDQLGLRRRRALLKLSGGGIAASALVAAGIGTGIAASLAVVAAPALVCVANFGVYGYVGMRDYFRFFKVPGADGQVHSLCGANVKETGLRPAEGGDGWALSLRCATSFQTLTGHDARRALGVLLPRVNALGANTERVRDAAERIAAEGGPDRYLAKMAAESARRTGSYLDRRARFRREPQTRGDLMGAKDRDLTGAPIDLGALPRLAAEERLALEIAIHEDAERAALDAEIVVLRQDWKEAEEIAAISDRLVTNSAVEERLAEMKAVSGTRPRG